MMERDSTREDSVDARLELGEAPREGVNPVLSELSPVTIAWRCLRSEYELRRRKVECDEERQRATRRVYVDLADDVFRLRRECESPRDREASGDESKAALAERLERSLAELGVEIVDATGAPYTGELLDVYESVAQRHSGRFEEPRIVEVLSPAVLVDGELARMGKSVVELPEDS